MSDRLSPKPSVTTCADLKEKTINSERRELCFTYHSGLFEKLEKNNQTYCEDFQTLVISFICFLETFNQIS